MNVAIVVNRFPVLSESFIVRLIESLDQPGVGLTIYALEGSNLRLLEELSPHIASRVAQGDIALRAPFDSAAVGKQSWLSWTRTAARVAIKHPWSVLKLVGLGLQIRHALAAVSFRELSNGSRHSVIHAQFFTVGVAVIGSYLTKGTAPPAPVVSYARGYDVCRQGAVRANEISIMRRNPYFAAVCCVSESLATKVLELGFDPSRVRVIYSGVPLAHLPFCAERNFTPEKAKFVQVGRLVDKKGHDLSLRMLAEFHPGATLEIVGDGPLRSELENLCEKLGLRDRVTFHGALSHRQSIRVVSECDFMLAPSRAGKDGDSEGIPNVLKEAMALGVVCIASNHSGIPELVSHGDTGFIFQENDLRSFFETARLAVFGQVDLRQMAVRARNKVMANFDTARSAQELIAFYTALATRPLQRDFLRNSADTWRGSNDDSGRRL